MKAFLFMRYYVFVVAIICLFALSRSVSLYGQQPDHPMNLTSNNTLFPFKLDTIAIQKLMRQGNTLVYEYPDSAIIIYNKVIKWCQLTGYYPGISRALLNIGACYVVKNNYHQAIEFFKKALPFCTLPGYNRQKEHIDFFNNMSVPYFRLGKNDSALTYLLKGLEIATHVQDTLRMIHFYANISGLWSQNSQFTKSTAYAQKGLDLALYKKDSSFLPQLYGIMASNSMDNRSLSLDYMHKALKSATSEQEEISILSKMGEIYIKNAMPDSAIYYLRKRLSLSNQVNLDVYSNLGKAYYLLQQNKLALQYMEQALTIAGTSGARNLNLTTTWYNIANILSSMGRYKEALTYLFAYADLSDSLLSAERNTALDLLDVKYRTAEKDKKIIAQQLLLAREQQKVAGKNTWIGSIIACLIFTIGFGLILYHNLRHKQRNQQNELLLLQQQKEIELLKAGMNGEEKERTRIAYELHDGIGGMLAAIKMNFGAVQERYEKAYGLKELNPIMHMVEDTTDELRKTAHNLMPGILLKHSMSEALRIYCSNINATGKLHISLRFYGQPDELPKDFQLMLYRIVQELLQNIIKHAYATQAVVELEYKEGQIHVLIEDDGAGFDTHTPENGGFGLQNLRFRVQALQGYIAIESAKGTGTTINITFDDEIVKSAFPL